MAWLPRKWAIGGTVLVLSLAGVLWVYWTAHQAQNQSDPERARRLGQPIPVRTAEVTQSDVEQVIGGTATTVASETGVIQISPSSGFNLSEVLLKVVHVREGDHVEPGQLLFELDDRVLVRVVRQDEEVLASAVATLERTKITVANNQKFRTADVAKAEEEVKYRDVDLTSRTSKLELLQKMHKDNAASMFEIFDQRALVSEGHYNVAISKEDLLTARNALAVGEATDREQLAVANSAVETARANLEAARRDVARCQITSPIDGFMDQVTIPAGQVVTVNTTITQVLKLDPIDIRMDFPQERLAEISLGQPAEVILDSFPQEKFTGSVIRIAPLASTQLRVIPVTVRVHNPGSRIKAGVTGFIRLHVNRKAPTVPSTAVIQQNNKTVVFRVEDGHARMREIHAGPVQEDGMMEVRDGLAAGDSVVVFHNFYRDVGTLTKGDGYLHDNDRVDVNWHKWARHE